MELRNTNNFFLLKVMLRDFVDVPLADEDINEIPPDEFKLGNTILSSKNLQIAYCQLTVKYTFIMPSLKIH